MEGGSGYKALLRSKSELGLHLGCLSGISVGDRPQEHRDILPFFLEACLEPGCIYTSSAKGTPQFLPVAGDGGL